MNTIGVWALSALLVSGCATSYPKAQMLPDDGWRASPPMEATPVAQEPAAAAGPSGWQIAGAILALPILLPILAISSYGGTYQDTIIHPDRSRTTYTTSYWGNTSTTRVRRTHR
jgi:hypothetical protein